MCASVAESPPPSLDRDARERQGHSHPPLSEGEAVFDRVHGLRQGARIGGLRESNCVSNEEVRLLFSLHGQLRRHRERRVLRVLHCRDQSRQSEALHHELRSRLPAHDHRLLRDESPPRAKANLLHASRTERVQPRGSNWWGPQPHGVRQEVRRSARQVGDTNWVIRVDMCRRTPIATCTVWRCGRVASSARCRPRSTSSATVA